MEKLVLHERMRSKRDFLVDPDESVNGYGMATGEFSAAHLEAFELPVSAAVLPGKSGVSDYHSVESHSDLKEQKVFLGTSSFQHDPQKVLTIHLEKQKTPASIAFRKIGRNLNHRLLRTARTWSIIWQIK